ncbi:type II toxin-antitoxin system PemK/MazF family toxin [Marinitenerispora sediminis]|uniref:Growth inhibitor PemK n=1 Tax=Marinitenerispora sediminis TaxID=1931232 RepID=A0A368T667_9ACTN|nr:type II toxin-antitoxin system PemK/MazF family toxin [Marinitenerispora sediminis]RCV51861.1 hypothetical protein DEF28_14430 [Marinitenerispora sediminis]RCV54816.1 hypothetical protein DEF23_15275 [Marinitenerispora sediminis]RCV58962.1 hypothetical protein DEF24_11595 [Marinitenerispora sediminis]
MKQGIIRGGIYRVPDRFLTFPPDYDREPHAQRNVIVISGDSAHEDDEWPIIMVVPCPSQATRRTKYCVKIPYGVGNMDKKCWARVVAAQPMAKDEVGDFVGHLPADMLEEIYLNWAEYTGQV